MCGTKYQRRTINPSLSLCVTHSVVRYQARGNSCHERTLCWIGVCKSFSLFSSRDVWDKMPQLIFPLRLVFVKNWNRYALPSHVPSSALKLIEYSYPLISKHHYTMQLLPFVFHCGFKACVQNKRMWKSISWSLLIEVDEGTLHGFGWQCQHCPAPSYLQNSATLVRGVEVHDLSQIWQQSHRYGRTRLLS